MKKELQVFLTAIIFYTRLPVPHWIDHGEELLNKATRYFPLIGWIVGAFTAAIFYGCLYVFPSSIALLFSITSGILLTGAFHEDGFADFCDAFGGGWTKERILTIMKDSRIGVFGAVGLLLILLFKFFSLSALPAFLIVKILLLAHVVSRFSATLFIFTSQYVRENDDSKAKPVGKKLALKDFLVASVFGLLPFLLFPWRYLLLLLPMAICFWWFRRYLHKWIGGYTGDCLGAIQQVQEVVVYLSVLILLQLNL